jgi:hypothetical protein
MPSPPAELFSWPDPFSKCWEPRRGAAFANFAGLLFFGYFLFAEAKESDLPPGNPRIGGGITVARPTHPAQVDTLSAPTNCEHRTAQHDPPNLAAYIILHNEKQIPR